MASEKEMREKVERVGMCQALMISAAEAFGFTVKETAAAAMFAVAGAFLASKQEGSREGLLTVVGEAYDLLARRDESAFAEEILARMEAKGKVS